MKSRNLSVIVLFLSIASVVQAPRSEVQEPVDDRKARVRELVSQNAGEITALEPSSRADGGVIVGFSSGDVVRCGADGNCSGLTGTPNVAVQHIAVSRRGASEILWVAYRQGALYQCDADLCSKVIR